MGWNNLTSAPVSSSTPAMFGPLRLLHAKHASARLSFVAAMMFARNDVVDLKRKDVELLRHPAIFAGRVGALPYLIYE